MTKHNVKVTRNGDSWLISVVYNGKVVCMYEAESKKQIGYACRLALRDCDKFYTGGDSYTAAVRKRMWDREKYPDQYLYHTIKKIL